MALGRSPSNLAEVLRKIRRDIEMLKRPRTIALGSWIISESQYGDLVADNTATGRRHILGQADKSDRPGPIEP